MITHYDRRLAWYFTYAQYRVSISIPFASLPLQGEREGRNVCFVTKKTATMYTHNCRLQLNQSNFISVVIL